MTFNELIWQVNQANLANIFACENNDMCSTLKSLTTEDGLVAQRNSFGNKPFAVHWIMMNTFKDELELNCTFFDTNGMQINSDKVAELSPLDKKIATAVLYTTFNKIKWSYAVNGKYVLSYPSNSMLGNALHKTLPTLNRIN